MHFALGPTHEEVVTDLVAHHISSYRQLPLTLYQIQTKFRNEERPRFGIVRTSEFLMKDAYSFSSSLEQLDQAYQAMYDAYCRIFSRCGLNYVPVEAERRTCPSMSSAASDRLYAPQYSVPETIVASVTAECPRPSAWPNSCVATSSM